MDKRQIIVIVQEDIRNLVSETYGKTIYEHLEKQKLFGNTPVLHWVLKQMSSENNKKDGK